MQPMAENLGVLLFGHQARGTQLPELITQPPRLLQLQRQLSKKLVDSREDLRKR